MQVKDRRGQDWDEPETPAEQAPEPADEVKPEVTIRDVVPAVLLRVVCACKQVLLVDEPSVVSRFLRDGNCNLQGPPCLECGTVLRLTHPKRPEQPRVVRAHAGPNRAMRRAAEAMARKGSR